MLGNASGYIVVYRGQNRCFITRFSLGSFEGLVVISTVFALNHAKRISTGEIQGGEHLSSEGNPTSPAS
jgi:hypothetical protein